VATLPEPVLKAPVDILQVRHAAGTSSLSPLGLETPVVAPQLSRGVAARRTLVVLQMKRPVTTSPAEGVGLGVAFTEGRCSL